ncbi:DNA-binding GntR family transcriptional regulator [Arthrobacter silviterrae]|uniref:GntR family transcriptional regulator n=1 Tax=Arthrobacter silviterrae TaxID=2026658 RepID=A0ABX0DCP9_9MICC|nr:GntR family transcriptional regulator [Arthrobacter silviterrae]MDQ0276459.1 DNA-binding GntR family transcriptional regulator [Arthrobacter silviterrae]NGN84703.1 GntR family transcriptional regulator [Arthrobacter silviterrae]
MTIIRPEKRPPAAARHQKNTPSSGALTADVIAEEVRNSIVSGEIPLGTAMTEKSMVAQYGVSRATVREVMQYLIAEGYLARRPYHSAYVRAFSSKEIRDLLEARELLEVHAGLQSINADANAKARLRRALTDYLTSFDEEDLAESSRRHRDLHVALVGMTGNDRLMRQEEQLMIDSSLVVAVIDARRDDVDKMKRMHTQLVDAFLDGDQQLSARLVREHLDMVHRAALEELDAVELAKD